MNAPQGLLNSSVPSQGMQSDSGAPPETNPILQQIEQSIESKVPPQLHEPYLQIVVAGNHALFSPKTLPMFTKIVANPDFVQQIPSKMANLMAMISNESGKNEQGHPNMNMSVVGPASMTLACHVLGFAAHVSGMQITNDSVSKTLHDVAMAVLQKFGIGPEQIAQAKAQAQNQPQGQQAAEQVQPDQPAAQVAPQGA